MLQTPAKVVVDERLHLARRQVDRQEGQHHAAVDQHQRLQVVLQRLPTEAELELRQLGDQQLQVDEEGAHQGDQREEEREEHAGGGDQAGAGVALAQQVLHKVLRSVLVADALVLGAAAVAVDPPAGRHLLRLAAVVHDLRRTVADVHHRIGHRVDALVADDGVLAGHLATARSLGLPTFRLLDVTLAEWTATPVGALLATATATATSSGFSLHLLC